MARDRCHLGEDRRLNGLARLPSHQVRRLAPVELRPVSPFQPDGRRGEWSGTPVARYGEARELRLLVDHQVHTARSDRQRSRDDYALALLRRTCHV